jgi:hypothetical protein
MEENIGGMLNELIANEIESISGLEAGSKEKTTAVENLATLYRLRIEENKSIWDADEKSDHRMMEERISTQENEIKKQQIEEQINRRIMEEQAGQQDVNIRRQQVKEQVYDRYFKAGIAVAELLIPLICYGIWMNKGFRFEETGTITSSTFKGLINRFRPTKK